MTSNNAAFLSASAESAILWDMQSLMPVNKFEDPAMRDVTAALFVPGDKQVILGTKVSGVSLFLSLSEGRELVSVRPAHLRAAGRAEEGA